MSVGWYQSGWSGFHLVQVGWPLTPVEAGLGSVGSPGLIPCSVTELLCDLSHHIISFSVSAKCTPQEYARSSTSKPARHLDPVVVIDGEFGFSD